MANSQLSDIQSSLFEDILALPDSPGYERYPITLGQVAETLAPIAQYLDTVELPPEAALAAQKLMAISFHLWKQEM